MTTIETRELPVVPERTRRRWVLPAVSAALVLVLAAATYLYLVAGSWQERADRVDAERVQLSAQLEDLQAQHDALTEQAAAIEAELVRASDRVRDLSDEKAQVADQREANAQAAERSSDTAQAAAEVAGAMGECATSLRALLDVVLSSPDYDYALAQRSASGADAACADAQTRQQAFLDSLGA